jgi:hypothetical protein
MLLRQVIPYRADPAMARQSQSGDIKSINRETRSRLMLKQDLDGGTSQTTARRRTK